jgi:hypothetical protein
LTVFPQVAIHRAVMPARQLVALLLLSVWAPAQSSWALPLIALSHGSHVVSFETWHGGSQIVLHHHAIGSQVHEHARHDHDHHADPADDPVHGDHVFHQPGTSSALTSKHLSAAHGRPVQLFVSNFVAPVLEHGALRVRLVASSPKGSFPPLRTVVLRI